MDGTRAQLTGHLFDLDLLAGLFRTGDPRLARDEDGCYWVESSRFDGKGEDLVALHQLAKDVLVLLNAAGRLDGPGFRPVDLRGRYERRGPDGPVQGTVVEAEAAELRVRSTVVATLSVTSGTVEPSHPAAPAPLGTPRIAALAGSNPAVAEVAQLLSKRALDWVVLYKIYEIVRDAVGGGQEGLLSAGLVTADDRSAFTASANHPLASGSEARHARQSGPAPKNVMSLPEAVAFVRRLVGGWLESLGAATEAPSTPTSS